MRLFHVLYEAAQVKTFIRFSSENSRSMVRAVLEPHPVIGLRVQDIYAEIHNRFAGAREKEFLIPPAAHMDNPALKTPPHREHPIRSTGYLKKTVIPEMVEMGEIECVHIKRGPLKEDGTRLDLVRYGRGRGKEKETLQFPTGIDVEQQWRWRIKPDFDLKERPDPSVETIYKAQSSHTVSGWHNMTRKAKERIKVRRVKVQLERYGRKLV